nr:hypothetical protein [uncultured Acidocella sp.]
MRRIVFASLLALAPGLAFAQAADNGANPPPPPPPGMAGGMGDMGPGPMGPHGGPWHHHGMGPQRFLTDFYAANTSHDGHLTLAQAKAANFKPVVDHFSQIDTAKRGYVTFYDIEAWHMDEMAKHLQDDAAKLRARDS